MFNPTKNVSPFDVNMAYETDYDGVIPYTNVTLEEIHALTQDTIFSRSKKGIKRTSIFIGGREFGMAIDMLNRARAAMVPPFEVSVFADPSGAITTAAALVAAIERCLARQGEKLSGKKIHIMGGTGPVGICAGILAESCGAEVYLVSHRGEEVAKEVADEYNARHHVKMKGASSRTDKHILDIIAESNVVVGAAKAGIRVLSKEQMKAAKKLMIAADVNAVPPPGIEGVEVHDMGRVIDGSPNNTLGIGALAIGDIKYKVHYRMFEMMKNADKPLYLDHVSAFEVAREIANS